MKKLFLLLLVLSFIPAFLHAQKVKVYSVKDLFDHIYDNVTSIEDSVYIDSNGDRLDYYVMTTVSGQTYTSYPIYTDKGNNNISFNGRVINLTGTMNVTIYLYVYRGAGTPDYTGYERITLATLSGSTHTWEYSINLENPDWANYEFWKFKVQVVQTGTQTNNVTFWIHRYETGR